MAKQRIKREKDFENGSVTFTVVESGESLTVSVKDIAESLTTSLLVHAINAKVGDAAADPNLPSAFDAMSSVAENLKNGTFNARSSGGGGARITQLANALQRVTGQEMEDVLSKLEAMEDDEKKALRKHPQVESAINDIKAEDAKAKAKAAAAAAKSGDALEF